MSAVVIEVASISLPLLGSVTSHSAMVADAEIAQTTISALTAFQRAIIALRV